MRAAAGSSSPCRGVSAPDEALIFEFADDEEFWMLTNMGAFWNSMDYLYRPVSHTPSRSAIDADGRVRMVMAHNDPGVHNWIDTQRFGEGYLTMRVIGSRQLPEVSTRVVARGRTGYRACRPTPDASRPRSGPRNCTHASTPSAAGTGSEHGPETPDARPRRPSTTSTTWVTSSPICLRPCSHSPEPCRSRGRRRSRCAAASPARTDPRRPAGPHRVLHVRPAVPGAHRGRRRRRLDLRRTDARRHAPHRLLRTALARRRRAAAGRRLGVGAHGCRRRVPARPAQRAARGGGELQGPRLPEPGAQR